MLEREIERIVCEYAKTKGFLVYKFTSPNRMAVPDRMFVTPEGHIFFCEFKATDKKPTPPQAREQARLRDYNVIVYVVDSVESGKEMIDWEITRCEMRAYPCP